MPKPIAWSWSRLDTFEKCPMQFYHKNVIKSVPFVQNDNMKRGERLHTHMENAIKGGMIHEEISNMAPLISRLRGIDWDDTLIEVECAFDEALRPVSWFDKSVWVRIKQDFLARKGKRAVSLDWKTGRNYGYTDQLKLYSAHAFRLWPEVEEVTTSYVYLDVDEKEERTFHRRDYDAIWHEFGDRAECIQIAQETGTWATKPSTRNCRWCAVKDCTARE